MSHIHRSLAAPSDIGVPNASTRSSSRASARISAVSFLFCSALIMPSISSTMSSTDLFTGAFRSGMLVMVVANFGHKGSKRVSIIASVRGSSLIAVLIVFY